MTINHVVIVLGKRLNRNLLTKEGRSRVQALVSYLNANACQQMAVAFCGGVTSGQSVSEAQVMHNYFQQLKKESGQTFDVGAVLLEQHSTNTVENIQNLAHEMIESALFQRGQNVKVTFVSNDYHLQRIFEIQELMDAQGLLKVLNDKCMALGVHLKIAPMLSEHIAVPYPHKSVQGELFLLTDELTTYRVYLEGVLAGVFGMNLEEVRQKPSAIALDSLYRIQQLLVDSTEFELVTCLLPVLESCIHNTPTHAEEEAVRSYLALLDTNLTLLNRYLDPEVEQAQRWWR
ncbi:YdcF family protein [Vibrio makurazakiensis]|uniref:YdcF family protein n=1 Tax=Vibrio makurazakiensis TaxID=2910250 RepID=UPI003D0EC52F